MRSTGLPREIEGWKVVVPATCFTVERGRWHAPNDVEAVLRRIDGVPW
jgi:hypothetical protein